mgnify:FL=1
MSTAVSQTLVCLSCSKMATRTVLMTPRCVARLHACVSPKRWSEMEERESRSSIVQGRYIGQERDLPVE